MVGPGRNDFDNHRALISIKVHRSATVHRSELSLDHVWILIFKTREWHAKRWKASLLSELVDSVYSRRACAPASAARS
jgi:hypothetical protein